MATYFHGNAEMQGNGDALQTLFLMNPTAYVGYSDNQHQLPPPPSATNFIYHGGGSIPGFHYNLYNPVINGGEAREVTRAKQGLSLSLSPQQPPPPPPQGEVRVSGGVSESVVLSCKYLKVAQQLLHEVVSIGKEVKNGRDLSKEENGQPKNSAESAAAEEAVDGGAKRGAELTAAEKQEIQMKKVKLVDMLNEVIKPILINF